MKAQDKVASEREGLLYQIDAKKSSGPRFFDKKSASPPRPPRRARGHTQHTKNGLTLGSTIYNYTSLSLHSVVSDPFLLSTSEHLRRSQPPWHW